MKILYFGALLVSFLVYTKELTIDYSPAFYTELATRIWRNEAGGSVEKLVWWNEGEAFVSAGIGHFLWYPREKTAPFTQTFPDVLRFLQKKGNKLPAWINEQDMSCPWNARSQVVGAADKRLQELRMFLHTTIADQAEFIVNRYTKATQSILKSLCRDERQRMENHMRLIGATPQGLYALIDYVNFKGEGTNPKERYNNQGWGLLHVLRALDTKLVNENPCKAFAQAAEKILRQRVRNAPKERHEERWLAGWLNRIATYDVQ